MNVHEIMYTYEHNILPENFYEYGTDFIAVILKRKDVLYRVINEFFDEEKVDNPYKEEDFELDVMNCSEDFLAVKLTFPLPKQEPLCYCSYIFIDKELQKLNYFCIERGDNSEEAYVCSWTKDRQHINYGKCSLSDQEDYEKCLNVYMR